ncbi:MAG: glycosyltransferase family 2 protein [Chitinophagaceae bacterium]|nr:glycosyltransferase family 2 protein [Chitinophagaceae bacterium]
MPVTDTKLSAVIATLGGDWLEKTISVLLSQSLPPAEILICIPEDHAHKVQKFSDDRVRIVATKVKGQVRQRAVGLAEARHPLALQVDDDIIFDEHTLERLAAYLLELGPKNVIGPVLYGLHTRACIHRLPTGLRGLPKNIFDYMICAAPWGRAKMGVVTKIGLNYGVDDRFCDTDLKKTQWLSGGCVLSFREDLVLEDFFPFSGKAYCEDVIHSFYRTRMGITSWVATRIKVFIDEPEPEFSRNIVDKVIDIRRYLLKLTGGPAWRLGIYEAFCKLRSFLYTPANPDR